MGSQVNALVWASETRESGLHMSKPSGDKDTQEAA